MRLPSSPRTRRTTFGLQQFVLRDQAVGVLNEEQENVVKGPFRSKGATDYRIGSRYRALSRMQRQTDRNGTGNRSPDSILWNHGAIAMVGNPN